MVRFFCFVFGDAYLDLLERVAVRSLLQSRNRGAIPTDAVVSLYSDAASIDRASQILSVLGRLDAKVARIDSNAEQMQVSVFGEEIERCHSLGATMVVLCPDNFWGDGSLANLLAIAANQQICIAAPHPRVDREQFLTELNSCGELNNPALVELAMRTLHPSWINAFADRPATSSLNAGISIIRLSDGLYGVVHRLPTVWLARFTKEDVGFFKNRAQSSGLWDHSWPQLLVRQERQKVIGSSDAFFVAELTPTESHNVELSASDPRWPDAYGYPSIHAAVNRNVQAIWRAAAAPSS